MTRHLTVVRELTAVAAAPTSTMSTERYRAGERVLFRDLSGTPGERYGVVITTKATPDGPIVEIGQGRDGKGPIWELPPENLRRLP